MSVQGGVVIIGILSVSLRSDFVILRRNGHWCVAAGGSYFGQYETPERALPLAIRVARSAAHPARVVVKGESGVNRVVWELDDQTSSLARIASR